MPTRLESAKRSAVEQFLKVEQSSVFSTFTVSTLPRHNVTGVGIGPKIVNRKNTGEPCVRFYVERKVPEPALPDESRLPTHLEGVPTDVIESGRFVAGSPSAVLEPPVVAAAVSPRSRIRPAQPGCSVGFQFTGNRAGFVMAGTFGAVVQSGNDWFVLSNNHVLADENDLPLGSPIFQPGLLDGGNPATDQIASLAKFIQINPAVNNLVDCAIAKFLDRGLVNPVFLPNIGKLANAAPVAPQLGMQVEKVGRTTGYTQGNIFELNFTVKVQYEMGLVVFDDQILVHGNAGSFSAAGDSGSLIVDRETKQGTALLFAGSDQFTIGNKLNNVLSALGVTLVI
jgi:hypothetical protein